MAKKYSSQLGHVYSGYGSHMPHVVVGLIRKFRTNKKDLTDKTLKTGETAPIKTDNPYPFEFGGENM